MIYNVNSRFFKIHSDFSNSLNFSTVGEFFGSQILRNGSKFEKKKKKLPSDVYVLHKTLNFIFIYAKKCTKRCGAVLLIKPITLVFSFLPSGNLEICKA